MPIPVGAGPAVPPSQGPPPVTRSIYVTRAAWIDPTGMRWELTDPEAPWLTTDDGVSGLGSTPLTFTTDDLVRGGTQVRHIAVGPRTITWPMVVGGNDFTSKEFIDGFRTIGRAFTMTRRLGPGTLRIERSDGEARQIQAYYQSGFDTSGGAGSYVDWDTFTLTLYCPDPYWTDGEPLTFTRRYIESTLDFQDPFFSVGASSTLGDTTIQNDGDVETFPDWRIDGPATSATCTNNDTGDSFTVDIHTILGRDLAAGETVTITGTPPVITGPTPAAGKDWNQAIDWASMRLWELAPGLNDVSFTIEGRDVGSAITLIVSRRYESA